MPRFIAIPVGQGDAFYLETKAGAVLVDGGRMIDGFGELFRQHTQRDGVDILVATHNDADHPNGVLGFLRAGLTCNEVWLPGRWAQLLPQVLRRWEEVVHLPGRQVGQVEQIRGIDDPLFESSLLEQYADSLAQQTASLRFGRARAGTRRVGLAAGGRSLA
jgi:glyoxylase-like metal-dependent hydrolase (beta-lactamase superfamily II)